MERQPVSNEQLKQDISAELEKSLEKVEHKSPDAGREKAEQTNRAEAAREIIEKHTEAPKVAQTETDAKPTQAIFTRLDAVANYRETLKSVQRRMPALSRGFSKVIHNPVVDKTSEVVGNTVLRPSIAAGAATTALLVGGFSYLFAIHYGYTLSGSEFVISLLVGGVIGLAVENFSKLLRKHKI